MSRESGRGAIVRIKGFGPRAAEWLGLSYLDYEFVRQRLKLVFGRVA